MPSGWSICLALVFVFTTVFSRIIIVISRFGKILATCWPNTSSNNDTKLNILATFSSLTDRSVSARIALNFAVSINLLNDNAYFVLVYLSD